MTRKPCNDLFFLCNVLKTEMQPLHAHSLLYQKADLYAAKVDSRADGDGDSDSVMEATECDLLFTHEMGSFKDFWVLFYSSFLIPHTPVTHVTNSHFTSPLSPLSFRPC